MYIYMYMYVCVCVCVCEYIYICGELVDFGQSEKMIKISGHVDKSNTYNGFSSKIYFLIQGRISSD